MAEFARLLGRSAVDVAPQLLGAELHCRGRSGRIVEVEAYTEDDPASHSFSGSTPRNATMFGRPGGLYVYLIYGMHLCANIVCGPEGRGEAVLVRALAPVLGVDEMYVARPVAKRDRDLCSGPGKLTAALGIRGDDDGLDLLTDGDVRLRAADSAPERIVRGSRIGVSKAVDRPWRFAILDDPNVSRPIPTQPIPPQPLE